MASRTNADGSFDSPSFNAIGEPYVDPKPNSRSQSSAKPFLTCNPKVGQTASNWGDSKLEFKRLSEGEPYQDPHIRDRRTKAEGRAKFITPNGFKYSNPPKKGGLEVGYPAHMDEGTYGKRGVRAKIENPAKKNILTQPMKKGGYGYGSTTIAKPAEFKGSPYNAEQLLARESRKKDKTLRGDRIAFKSTSHPLECFDGSNASQVSQVYAKDASCLLSDADPLSTLSRKEQVETTRVERKPFCPSSPSKFGNHSATFEKFPSYSNDAYDEKAVANFVLPDRHLPRKRADMNQPDSIKERKPFKPSNPAKGRVTVPTALMGITKHHV